ncbi:YihY/virulence factor BrkB family protein [Roseococcus sp.]|uniref:YihY/virulence factor BrkB family protein n=1 Tax=Roseococcus sp. TaxID=2109646 RepID=UPI003BA8DB6B
MLGRVAAFGKDVAEGFVADDVLTRAAAIAYFALFSLGPLLFLITGICGLVFGEAQVRAALANQLRDLMGGEAAGAVQGMAQGALGDASGGWALAIGLATLSLTATGAFGALQGALNAIWKTETPPAETSSTTAAITQFVRAKALSLGVVGTTGFLLLVSLVVNAALSAFELWLHDRMPGLDVLLGLLNFFVSLIFITLLFAAIYKILPERRLHWRDVLAGAFMTALLFSFGRMAISAYIGRSGATQGFGAAGAFALVLLWLYYSAVIFLLGAEFTRAWSGKAPASAPKAPMVGVETLPPALVAASSTPVRAEPAPALSREQDATQAAWIMALLATFAVLGLRSRRQTSTGETT